MSSKTTVSEPLHLLRHLLRACTYLPDPAARIYFHAYILHRFRNKPTPLPTDAARARKSISLLNRASNGDLPALTKVMEHTYGRAGKRRFVLLDDILRQQARHNTTEPPTDVPANVRRVLKPPTTVSLYGGTPTAAKPHDAPPTPFERLLADQIIHHPDTSNRTSVKSPYAPVPAESAFKRPIAVRRERGLRRSWRKDTMEKILPPLPEKEWDRLRDLATGVMVWDGRPKRRTPVGVEKEGGLLSVEYLKLPITQAHAKVRRKEIAQRDWHALTPKFMQRMYASMWELCPKARWDENRRDWVYTWGERKSAASRVETNKVQQRDLQLFEGIEKLNVKKARKFVRQDLHQYEGAKKPEGEQPNRIFEGTEKL